MPSGLVDSFDNYPTGQAPAGWTPLTDNSTAAFFIRDDPTSGTDDLALAFEPGSPRPEVGWIWNDKPFDDDVRVTADVLLEYADDVEVIARGTQTSTTSPHYYAARLTRGNVDLRLVKVTGDAENPAVLASRSSSEWITSGGAVWGRVTLEVTGSQLRAKLQRLNDKLFLQTDGSWAATEVWAVEANDSSSPLSGDRVGLGRDVKNSNANPIYFDNFAADPADAVTDNFDRQTVAQAPAGWTPRTDNDTAAFFVRDNHTTTDQAEQLLAFEPGTPRPDFGWIWNNEPVGPNVSARADALVGNHDDAELIVRASDTTTNEPSYYAARITAFGHVSIQLVKVEGDAENPALLGSAGGGQRWHPASGSGLPMHR